MKKLLYDVTGLALAKYYVYNDSTIRKTADAFGVPKTRVHMKLLKFILCHDKEYEELAKSVKSLIEKNKLERYVRGGNATKNKYMERRKNKKQ